MRKTPDEAILHLSLCAESSGFDRVALARELIGLGAAHAVAIADLGHEAGRVVTRGLVVQAKEATAARALIGTLARGPLPGFDRPEGRMLDAPATLSRRHSEPLGVDPRLLGPELRYFRADEVHVHTYVGLFGKPGSNGIGRGWRAFFARVTPLLAELVDRERLPFAKVGGSVAVDAGGGVLAADGSVEPWLREGNRAHRLGRLLDVGRADDAVDGPLDGARVRLRAARGSMGASWLGTIRAAEPLERASDGMLTPTQREVASYAAVGATCAEIARTLGVRKETVRSHVRDIYARLGISSRAELAGRLAGIKETAALPRAA